MTSPFGPLVLIANSRSRAGLGGVGPVLRAHGLDYRVVLTTGPGHAAQAAADALANGDRYLVAAGGDGTVHEVLNGMFAADGRPAAADAVLGVLPLGSGCDFVRSFGIPRDATAAAQRLAGPAVRVIDVGKVTFEDDSVHYFANIAEAGLGGSVVARAARLPGALGGARYGVAFWLALPRFRQGPARIEVDGNESRSALTVNVVVANCQYYGGGMRISPKSAADDGALDVLVMDGPRRVACTTLPSIYRGRHLPHRYIRESRGQRVRVESPTPLLVEADGEVLGSTPATFEIVPGVLRLKV